MLRTSSLQQILPYASRKRTLIHRAYTLAVTRAVPDSMVDALVHFQNSSTDFSLAVARQQHADYVSKLREIVPVIEMPALEEHPDCPFVEDTVVAIDRRAVLTRPGHVLRQGEVPSMHVLLRDRLGMECVVMPDDVSCDGGDVLYTGKEIFVGISERTTRAGASFLQETFPDIPVHTIPLVNTHALHLKSVVTHLDEDTVLAPDGSVQELLCPFRERGYAVVTLSHELACNVVRVNGHVLLQDTQCAKSHAKLEEVVKERGLHPVWIDSSELAKKDSALTCCSVLLNI